MTPRISFGPESLKDHLERVNEAIVNKTVTHDEAIRSIELVKARALVAVVDQLYFITDKLYFITDKLDSIKARLGE